jgi:transposase
VRTFEPCARNIGISTKTGYKWRERFLRQGVGGLAEESRRPQSSPQQLSQEEVCEIVRLKLAHPHWGPRKIRELYLRQHGQVASESSFKRVLEEAGLTHRRKKRRAREAGRLSSGNRAQGINEIWTVDFKGWWHGTEGRCEPLTVRDEFSRYLLELRRVPNAPQRQRGTICQPHRGPRFEPFIGLVGGIGNQSGTRPSWPSPR